MFDQLCSLFIFTTLIFFAILRIWRLTVSKWMVPLLGRLYYCDMKIILQLPPLVKHCRILEGYLNGNEWNENQFSGCTRSFQKEFFWSYSLQKWLIYYGIVKEHIRTMGWCCWEDGRSIHPRVFLRHFKMLLKRAGITKNLRFHDMRHTFATLAIESGVPIKTVQEMLGHENIQTTLGTYAHVSAKMRTKAAEIMTGHISKHLSKVISN